MHSTSKRPIRCLVSGQWGQGANLPIVTSKASILAFNSWDGLPVLKRSGKAGKQQQQRLRGISVLLILLLKNIEKMAFSK